MSVAQPWEKLSNASTSTPRAPSSDQSAISTAPVSEAGTMPSFQSSGMPRSARERAMTSARRALPSLARWLRPRNAPFNPSSEEPGRFAQGPEEKLGLAGRTLGREAAAAMWLSLPEEKRPGGGA